MALTEIGKQVKIKLIQDEMTQTELAERLGTTKQLLNNYLHGESNAKLDQPIKDWLLSDSTLEKVKQYYRELNGGEEYIVAGHETIDDDYVQISMLNKYHEYKDIIWHKGELASIVGKFHAWEIDYFKELLRG